MCLVVVEPSDVTISLYRCWCVCVCVCLSPAYLLRKLGFAQRANLADARAVHVGEGASNAGCDSAGGRHVLGIVPVAGRSVVATWLREYPALHEANVQQDDALGA